MSVPDLLIKATLLSFVLSLDDEALDDKIAKAKELSKKDLSTDCSNEDFAPFKEKMQRLRQLLLDFE